MGIKGASNRQRIVYAADQLFYQRGFNQTSFQDISDSTGIPRGNFYYYFKTKDDILDAVVQARCDSFAETLQSFDELSTDPHERLMMLAELLDTNQDSVIESGCPIGTLSSELAKDSDTLQIRSRAVFEVIQQWTALQFRQLGKNQADNLAMDLLARMQGITVLACAFKDADFLQRSLKDLKQWINHQSVNA